MKKLNFKRPVPTPKKFLRGFTLVEMLIVIGISAMLSTLAILYNHVGAEEISLSVESAKISQLILQAKELSIATYVDYGEVCGYGVHFDYASQTYSIFGYSSSTCLSAASTSVEGISPANIQEYAEGSWNIHVTPGVVLQSNASDTLTDVVFYPPDPTTLISRDDQTFLSPEQTSKIYLSTVSGVDTATISVSPAGQVTF